MATLLSSPTAVRWAKNNQGPSPFCPALRDRADSIQARLSGFISIPRAVGSIMTMVLGVRRLRAGVGVHLEVVNWCSCGTAAPLSSKVEASNFLGAIRGR